MKEHAAADKFGKLIEINRTSWEQEITNAPKDVFVIIHLYQDYVAECHLLNDVLA